MPPHVASGKRPELNALNNGVSVLPENGNGYSLSRTKSSPRENRGPRSVPHRSSCVAVLGAHGSSDVTHVTDVVSIRCVASGAAFCLFRDS